MSYAGVGIRFFAVFVDGILLFVLAPVVAVLTGHAYAFSEGGIHEAGFDLSGIALVLWLALAAAYYVVMEAAAGGSVGKLVAGLRVVDEDGYQISWRQSLVRNLLRAVDVLFAYLVAAISVWSSPKRQRLGDRAASTFVVHVPR